MGELVGTGKIVRARAPSNIALVKYMGKQDATQNIPDNPSISMTLHSLCTVVEIEVQNGGGAQWIPEPPREKPHDLLSEYSGDAIWQAPRLSDAGQAKLLRHVERVRDAVPSIFVEFGIKLDAAQWKSAQLVLRTANTFPAGSGIASSASSFAAVTLATVAAFVENGTPALTGVLDKPLARTFARLSRFGSGSSCRSFEGPWVYWDGIDASAIPNTQLPELAHFVILFNSSEKKVSSSTAHALVKTSPLWHGRADRARERAEALKLALQEPADSPTALARVSKLAWQELWEMHSLFHTASEPFTYWEPATVEALQYFAPWMTDASPPIVTLDAGPNIHVLVPMDARDQWRERLHHQFMNYKILEDHPGRGGCLNGIG